MERSRSVASCGIEACEIVGRRRVCPEKEGGVDVDALGEGQNRSGSALFDAVMLGIEMMQQVEGRKEAS